MIVDFFGIEMQIKNVERFLLVTTDLKDCVALA